MFYRIHGTTTTINQPEELIFSERAFSTLANRHDVDTSMMKVTQYRCRRCFQFTKPKAFAYSSTKETTRKIQMQQFDLRNRIATLLVQSSNLAFR